MMKAVRIALPPRSKKTTERVRSRPASMRTSALHRAAREWFKGTFSRLHAEVCY
jgi:hypothetical protein